MDDPGNDRYAVVRYSKEDDDTIYLGYRVASARVDERDELVVLDTGSHIIYQLRGTNYKVSHNDLFSAIMGLEEERLEEQEAAEGSPEGSPEERAYFDGLTTDQQIYYEEKDS